MYDLGLLLVTHLERRNWHEIPFLEALRELKACIRTLPPDNGY